MVTGKKRSQMSFALWSMCNRHNTSEENIYKCNSRIYEISKKLCAIASSKLHKGKILSQETKDKLSIARTGKKLSEEHKAKINPTGRILSTETKEKISKGQMGRVGGMQDKQHSQETKDKISASNIGKIKKPLSEERKNEISKQFSGTVQSEEHISKRIVSRLANGHYKDRDATIEKMRVAAANRPKYECHCGKLLSPSNFKRWHGDNCKN